MRLSANAIAAPLAALTLALLAPRAAQGQEPQSVEQGMSEAVDFIKGGNFGKATRGYHLQIRNLDLGYAIDFQRLGKTQATLSVTDRKAAGKPASFTNPHEGTITGNENSGAV